jgi:hypothetical protein
MHTPLLSDFVHALSPNYLPAADMVDTKTGNQSSVVAMAINRQEERLSPSAEIT